MRSVTRKPPTTLIVPKTIAMTSSSLLRSRRPARSASRPPSTTIPWIAFVPDISGVCSVFGTFEITAKPTKPASTRIARFGDDASGCGRRGLRRLVDDLAVARCAPAMISSSKSRCERRRPRRASARAAPGRCARRAARRARPSSPAGSSGETIVTSCSTTVSPGSVSSQLPPASPARSTIDAAGLHALDRLGGDQASAPGGPGTSAVVMTTSKPVIASLSACCCCGLLLVGQLAGVAALAGAPRRRASRNFAPSDCDLLGDLGAHVVAGDLRAEAPRRGDRLQAGDAGAEHEHLGRAGSCPRRSSASGRSAAACVAPSSAAL